VHNVLSVYGGAVTCHAASPKESGLACVEADADATSVWATRTMVGLRAVVVSAKVDCLAAKRAAVVDERLVLLDGHCDRCCVEKQEEDDDGLFGASTV